MNDCVYTCSDHISVNPCFPIYLFVNRANENLQLYIRLNNGGTVNQQVKSDSAGRIRIMFLSDYITNGVIEVRVKTSSGVEVPIPFGSLCTPFCGVELRVELSHSDNFPNKKCSNSHACTWSIPVKACTFTIPVKACTWVTKTMNKVIHNNVEYKITATPTIVVANVVQVNPAFVAELNAIESTAFAVTLIGTNISVVYTGTANVELQDNCTNILKICTTV